MWIARIKGVPHGLTSLNPILYDDFDTLRAARVEEDAGFIRLVDGMDAAALNRPVRYTRMTLEIGAALSSGLRQLTGGAQLSLFITTT